MSSEVILELSIRKAFGIEKNRVELELEEWPGGYRRQSGLNKSFCELCGMRSRILNSPSYNSLSSQPFYIIYPGSYYVTMHEKVFELIHIT